MYHVFKHNLKKQQQSFAEFCARLEMSGKFPHRHESVKK